MIGIDASVEDVNFGLGTLVELEEELASGNDDGKLATKRTQNSKDSKVFQALTQR